MKWWYLKIAVGLLLIGQSVAANLGSITVIYRVNSIIPVLVIVLSGLANLYHYYLIRHRNNNIRRPDKLVTDRGLFRFIRHPMYLCDISMYLGFSIFPVTMLSVVLFVVAIPVIVVLARYEDSDMKIRFEDQFARWSGKTGLLLPF